MTRQIRFGLEGRLCAHGRRVGPSPLVTPALTRVVQSYIRYWWLRLHWLTHACGADHSRVRHFLNASSVVPSYRHTRLPSRRAVGASLGAVGCIACRACSHTCVVYDNLSNSSKASLDRVEKITGVKPHFIEGDLRDVQLLEKVTAHGA